MKRYADNKQYVKPSQLQLGDAVLVRQQKTNKLSTPYDPRPLVITDKKGTMGLWMFDLNEYRDCSVLSSSIAFDCSLFSLSGLLSPICLKKWRVARYSLVFIFCRNNCPFLISYHQRSRVVRWKITIWNIIWQEDEN
jgi:hypothetical protein